MKTTTLEPYNKLYSPFTLSFSFFNNKYKLHANLLNDFSYYFKRDMDLTNAIDLKIR